MPERQRKQLILVGCWWFLLIGASQAMIGPLGERLASSFGVHDGGVNLMANAFFMGSCAMIVASIFLADRLSPLRMIVGCATFFAVGCAGVALAPSWIAVLASLACVGIGYGGISAWVNAQFVGEFSARGEGGWLQAVNGFWGVGSVIGPFIVRRAILAPQRPHAVLLGLSVLGFLALVGLKRPQPHHAHEAGKLTPWPIVAFGLLMGLYVGTEVTTSTMLVRHLTGVHGVSEEQAIGVASLLWLAFTLGRFAASSAASRWHPSVLISIAAACAAGGGILALNPQTATAGYLLIGATMSPIFPAILDWACRGRAPSGQVTGLVITCGCLAAAVSPMVIRVVAQQHLGWVPAIIAGSFAVIALLSLSLRAASVHV